MSNPNSNIYKKENMQIFVVIFKIKINIYSGWFETLNIS